MRFLRATHGRLRPGQRPPIGAVTLRRLIAGVLVWLATLPAAHAHLMVAQRGTINIVGDGAFMVLSLPVSAFTGVDDDGDRRLSMAELRAHSTAIATAVEQQVRLMDDQGPRPLEGLMLTLSPPDNAPQAPAAQLVAMGRFVLASPDRPLRLEAGLFGQEAEEQSLQLTVTRDSLTHLLRLTPDQSSHVLFPSGWAVFVDHVVLGAEHIVTGFDHLLFLLVVLAAGWSRRQVLLALTSFTLGHAITLVASAWGGFTVPAAVVEPAIAATIVGMVVFDACTRQLERTPPPWLRLLLVFGCALIHGLGLSTALTGLGLDSSHRLQSLAGFNVGIELAQLAVALSAALFMAGVRRLRGEIDLVVATCMASAGAMMLGSAWFVQRVFGAG